MYALIPIVVGFGANFVGTVLDVKGWASSAARSNKYFEQYNPEIQQKLVKEILSSYATTVNEAQKKTIYEPMDNVLALLNEYQNNREAQFDAAPLAQKYEEKVNEIKLMNDQTNKNFADAKKRTEEDILIFQQLIKDLGKPDSDTGRTYHAEDILTRPYKIRDRVSNALKRQYAYANNTLDEKLNNLNLADFDNQAEMDAFKGQMRKALKTAHDKEMEEIMRPLNESTDALHKVANDQYYENAFIAQQQDLFKELCRLKEAEAVDANTVVECGADSFHMSIVNLETLPEDLAKINEERAKRGEEALSITSSAGNKIELKRNDDKTCTVSAYIPMGMNLNFHHNPRQHMKDLIQTQLTTAIALGMTKGGIVMKATHANQEEAEKIAQTQYIAAISMGIPAEKFSCKVNGVEKSHSDIEKMIAESGRSYELSEAREQAGRFMKQHSTRENKLANHDKDVNLSDQKKYEDRKNTWKQNPESAAKIHNQALKEQIVGIREPERKADKDSWSEAPAAPVAVR